MIVPCISIRQPWAWLICHQYDYSHGKTIENRDEPLLYHGREYRGRIYIHSGKNPDPLCIREFFIGKNKRQRFSVDHVTVNGRPIAPMVPSNFPYGPHQETPKSPLLDRWGGWMRDHAALGGIVGMATVVGSLRPGDRSDSFWYLGGFALRLRNAIPLPFFPCPGKLGLFDFEDEPLVRYYQDLIMSGYWTWPIAS